VHRYRCQLAASAFGRSQAQPIPGPLTDVAGGLAMATCLIALGSNLGDRAAALTRALELLQKHPAVESVIRSQWLANPPIGGPEGQDEFINAAARVTTSLAPIALLELLHSIETEVGRVRRQRWASRLVDLDLLLYDDLVLDSGGVQIPHPRMAFRRFVLEPAVQVAGDMVHPVIGWTLRRLLQHLDESFPYIAITGPPGVGKSRLARDVAADEAARWLSDRQSCADLLGFAESSPEDCEASYDREYEILRCRAEVLQTRGDERSGETWISDFWIGQSWAYARHQLPASAFADFCKKCQDTIQSVTPPKLLVMLSPETACPGPHGGKGEGRSRFHAALQETVRESHKGPLLQLAADQPAWARTELVAAIQAMQ
jgi:2-amino-4-hydroxy-6-hydroxymethyldihydropteridine diphosphokinase